LDRDGDRQVSGVLWMDGNSESLSLRAEGWNGWGGWRRGDGVWIVESVETVLSLLVWGSVGREEVLVKV